MKLKYRPEIDGLRAIAVVPVLLFHAGFSTFSGGYSGVDVFFVISGYLITSIIYQELEKNKFSIVNFYERRARRILPLLFCVLLSTIPLAWFGLYQTDIIDYFESLVAVPLFFSNFLFVLESNYFDAAVDLKPLLHTWSLAVEEQYYIFFPLIMILFFKFSWKKRIIPFLIICCLLSLLLSEWASIAYPSHNFYLLPSRIWELGIGAILAILISSNNVTFAKARNNTIFSETLGILGLVLILLGIFMLDEETPFPSLHTMYPVLGTGLIIGFTEKDSIIGKILSLKPIIFIGLLSYSIYLWHQPIFAFAKHLYHGNQNFLEKSILCVVVFPISYLSWRFIENPFRNKQKFNRKFIFIFSLLGSLFFIAVGLIGIFTDGFPNRAINKKLEIQHYNPDNRALKVVSWEQLHKAKDKLEENRWFVAGNELPNVLLVGNSHSKDLYNVLMASRLVGEKIELGQVSLQIWELNNPNHELFNSVNYKEADVIVLASRYSKNDIPNMRAVIEKLLKDGKKIVAVKEIHNFEIINAKTKADLLIQEYIRNGFDLNDNLILKKLVKEINESYYKDFLSGSYETKSKSDAIIEALKVKHPELIVLDKMDYINNPSSQSSFAINSKLEKYFYDYGHHTNEGALFFGKRVDKTGWFDPVLNSLDDFTPE